MAKSKSTKYVYTWGNKKADGDGSMKPLLGGKGANLAEMTRIGLPVPPGFTITTDAFRAYQESGEAPDGLWDEIRAALTEVERTIDRQFGNPDCPLLVSVRS